MVERLSYTKMVDQPGLAYFDFSKEMDDGVSARMLVTSIRRHLGVVLVLCLLFSAAGAVIGLGLPPQFQAEGVLVIHSRPERVSDVQEVLPDASADLLTVRSEADVLESRSVIEPVVRSLALWGLPEFQKREYPGGWSWEGLERRLLNMWDAVEGRSMADIPQPSLAKTLRNDGDAPEQAKVDEAVSKYTRYLSVGTDQKSMTIHVLYRAWTPESAAAIVNAHLESYQRLQVQAKTVAAQSANSWLTNRVDELQNQLQTAEIAVARYREEHHLTGTAKDNSALSQQLASLNSQLITAQADLAESEMRAASIGVGAATKGRADSVPEVVASPTIQSLRGQEAQLVQREADLSAHHGDSYPELQNVRASLRDLRGAINREISRGHAAALQLVERSRARERSIQQAILGLTSQVNSKDAGLQQLEGRAESIRTVLHGFEKKLEQTAAGPAFIASNSTIISRANPSATWSSSKVPVLAGAGGFVGLTLGGLLALFLEHRDKTFRTSTQVQQHVNARAVGATPRATRRALKYPTDLILADNRSAFAEALRLSWANIQLSIEDPQRAAFGGNGGRGPGKALGITSAVSGEGKSIHALALARTAVLAGDRVVLVDADLRRSGVSRLLGGDFRFTLDDFLQSRCAAGELLAVEECSGLHFVPSTPVDVLWTNEDLRRFTGLIDNLRAQFALVIIDMPPILGLAETIRLTVATDGIVLIIRWGRTERQLVQYALDRLRTAGAAASAVILNDVDLKAQQRRGDRDQTVVYRDAELYRATQKYPEPIFRRPRSAWANASEPNLETAPSPPPQRAKAEHHRANSSDTDISDILRLYDRNFDE
jgi:uncharacterized protein involved in exopolysaccharide biosynthesis/Mrp family chromosome partitioning ATPase